MASTVRPGPRRERSARDDDPRLARRHPVTRRRPSSDQLAAVHGHHGGGHRSEGDEHRRPVDRRAEARRCSPVAGSAISRSRHGAPGPRTGQGPARHGGLDERHRGQEAADLLADELRGPAARRHRRPASPARRWWVRPWRRRRPTARRRSRPARWPGRRRRAAVGEEGAYGRDDLVLFVGKVQVHGGVPPGVGVVRWRVPDLLDGPPAPTDGGTTSTGHDEESIR